MINTQDHYAALGVEKTASADDIKKAYRKLAMKYHPDRNPDDNVAVAKMQEINEAYGVLGDEEKRVAYDAQLRPRQKHAWPNRNNFGGYDDFFKDSTESYYNQRQTTQSAKESGYDYGDFAENFRKAKSGGGSYDPWGKQATHADKTIDITITLEEAFLGGERQVTYETDNIDWGSDAYKHETVTVVVTIPPGIEHGQKLKCAGSGPRNYPGQRVGDLYLNVHIARHEHFVREGDDITHMTKLSVLDLVLGTEIKVPTLEGSTLLVPVRAGTQPHSKIRIPNRGMCKLKSKERGHLYIEFVTTVPDVSKLTPDQIEQLTKLNEALKA
jgi:DnaJ-class molecular chaperone